MVAAWSAYECDIHLVPFAREQGCTYCIRFLEAAPSPSLLSVEVKVEELERWLLATRSVPEDMFYARIEALVGRRISPHELDDPDTLIRRAQRPGRTYDWDDW
ncbi:MAG: hypothetical protein ABI577_05325 [bacterium]